MFNFPIDVAKKYKIRCYKIILTMTAQDKLFYLTHHLYRARSYSCNYKNMKSRDSE